jgi:hypothetical protein
MATKLAIFNATLRELGSRKLSSLTESREPRRVLDDCWEDVLSFCIEQGAWNWAIRSQEIAASTSITPTFGYAYAFEKPTDWVRTVGLAGDEYFQTPLLEYQDETGYWWADIDPIYVRYVSDDPSYGYDLGAWPATFQRFVELYLAYRAAPAVVGSDSLQDRLEKRYRRALTDARSKDAMGDPTTFPPTGSWVKSRGGRWNQRSPDRA